jgi:hypothetical protein
MSVRFTKITNGPEATDEFAVCRVAAAYPQGIRDITASLQNVPQTTQQVQGSGVEIVPSIDVILKRVDCVLLESNDGRVGYSTETSSNNDRANAMLKRQYRGPWAITEQV